MIRWALILCLAGGLAVPAQAGLLWDAAVARHRSLIDLCVAHVAGMPAEDLQQALAQPGPVQDELHVSQEDGVTLVRFVTADYHMGQEAGQRSCAILSNDLAVREDRQTMVDEAYRGWRYRAVQTGRVVERPRAGLDLVDGAQDQAVAILSSAEGAPSLVQPRTYFHLVPAKFLTDLERIEADAD